MFGVGIGCESSSKATFDWSILTLTDTTAPLTRSTTSANDAGPADSVLAAASAGWLATGKASTVRTPATAIAAAPSNAARSGLRSFVRDRRLATLTAPLSKMPPAQKGRRD